MVGGVDGEEEKRGEVMRMHDNEGMDRDRCSMHSGSIFFSASYSLTGWCWCPYIASEGFQKHDIRSPQCVTRKARYESHRIMRWFPSILTGAVLKSRIRPAETSDSHGVMRPSRLLPPAASCLASPAVMVLASISSMQPQCPPFEPYVIAPAL